VLWTSYGPDNEGFDPALLKGIINIYLIGLGVSHLFRSLIIERDWLQMSIGGILPRLVIGSLVMGVFAMCVQILVHDLFFSDLQRILNHSRGEIMSFTLNWMVLLLLWSLFYFAYHYFVQNQRQEIRNLKLITSMREIELSNLRSQLNPHFMFNAMNSIRALVDEDPERAKTAITELSSIMRNSLLSGRKKLITLEEELALVDAYLDLETIRFEERLSVHKQVADEALPCMIPPMMLQTLVENAVKHGISKLTSGGELHITAESSNGHLHLNIKNSGTFEPGSGNSTGIGLRNTRKRLNLLFGKQADLQISNSNGYVLTRIRIPIQAENESVNN
jgi:LytS/YehU family sensor histidine kinase